MPTDPSAPKPSHLAQPSAPSVESANPSPKRPGPASLWDLFWTFTLMALQGFGGVLAVVQRILVDQKKWLTVEEFVEQWAVAQVLPGPNVLNLCIILGGQYFGLAGAVVATLGILLAPLVLVLGLAAAFSTVSDLAVVQGALRGLSAVVAGVILAVALRMTPALATSPLGRRWVWPFVAATFVLVGLLHIRLVWVLLALGPPACFLAAWQLRRQERSKST